jgi:hypothetical protein
MNQYFYFKLPSQVESILFSKRPECYSPASFWADLSCNQLCSKSAILKCKIQTRTLDFEIWSMNQYFYFKLPSQVKSILFSKRPECYSPARFWAHLSCNQLCSKSAIIECKIQTAYFEPWNLINESIFLLQTAISGKEHIMFKEPWRLLTNPF